MRSNEGLRAQFVENNKNQALYGSAPLTHISPDQNQITYALGFEWPDYTITADTEDPSYQEQEGVDASLKISGWSVAPHLAVSLKNIGLGFSVGRGEKKAAYEYNVNYGGNSTFIAQESKLAYGDVGLLAYFIPYPKISKGLRATVILGGRSINAKHTVGATTASYNSPSSSFSDQIYRYNVNELNAGLNLKFKILRRFAIIPWADYRYTDTSAIDATAEEEAGNSINKTELQNDIELFWHSQPEVRYGIDFSIQIMRLEINIGGLLGALALSGNGKESVSDDGFIINFAIHQKGN
ncbi:hypothetical protein SAMN06296036_104312 [Pseudobacteriovorax antillogorgiicola]|uniref:Uncharacterized protein n=1 Tax=Pseudobacteriovorax antillogorgiicola TaxID=1513793 RepID=A0A1Y6BMQ4_9BACT|nr:hypothetical protein EDD56_10422 [Pseudobacteriovorax antillogorgiicola]SMF08685.1 hypothetical protein SAMN06296036_104312 [Pseudobacteriovorax antillogorgiicola]